MKTHQLARHVGGCCEVYLLLKFLILNVKRELNEYVVGGMRISKIPESDLILEAKPRTKNFIHEKTEKKV